MEFSKRLKDLRIEKGLTQKQLAKAINVTNDCIHFWEKERSEPSISQIILLATFFEVSTDFLLGKTDY